MFAKLRLMFLCCFLLYWPVSVTAQTGRAGDNTVEILIDVSGSMKRNDPDNMRISALRLLINLLPEQTRAGIWLFAEKPQMLAKTAAASSDWKKNARAVAGKIHSRGLYTDLERALRTILRDASGDADKNLILLTDGRVDISEDIMQSADSRERIISDLIPELLQRRIRVMTIALSENADKELLEKLAYASGGWFESPASAQQLQKTFLTMFNQALPQDSVPLTNNRFNIDGSVEEFSVLVFKQKGAPETQLISPSGQKMNHDVKQEYLSWLQDQHYDLISVRNPEIGGWEIVADIDSDNQVMVMTDLKLHLNEPPTHIAEGETIALTASLSEHGKTVTNDALLQLVEMTLQQTDDLKRKSEWRMPAVEDQQGLFRHTLGETLNKGRHTLRVVVDGKTFLREWVRNIEVVDSVLAVKTSLSEDKQGILLELLPDAEFIDPDMLTAQVLLHVAGKPAETIEMQPGRDGALHLRMGLPAPGEKLIVNFNVMAKSVRGVPMTPDIKPLVIDQSFVRQMTDQQSGVAAGDQALPIPEQVLAAPQRHEGEHGKSETEDDVSQTQDELSAGDAENKTQESWVFVAGIVGVMNLVLLVAGYFGYKAVRTRTRQKQEELLGRLT